MQPDKLSDYIVPTNCDICGGREIRIDYGTRYYTCNVCKALRPFSHRMKEEIVTSPVCYNCGINDVCDKKADTVIACEHKEPKEARRDNEGKIPYANLPMDLLAGSAYVMAYGEKRYGRANYRQGYADVYSPLNSLMRHVSQLQAALEIEDKDGSKGLLIDESGFCHVHHVVTSALLLIHTMKLKGYKV